MKRINEDRGDKAVTRETRNFTITKTVDRDENGKLISRKRNKVRKGEETTPDDGVTPPNGENTTPPDGGNNTPPEADGGENVPDTGPDAPDPDTPVDVNPPSNEPDGGNGTPPDGGNDTPPEADGGEPVPDTGPDGGDVTPPDPDAPTPNGIIEFLNNNWKTIAIVAGAAAIIAGIVSLIKGMNKTIKVRYNKAVKTLQRAQKDFTMSANGLDMRDVMPGVGSRIFDKMANLFTWKAGLGKKNRSQRGAIGIVPFCTQYKEEINEDLRMAQEAFSKIKLAGDEMEQGLENEKQNSSVNTKVYNSFYEALNSDVINESEKLNEIGAMAAISTAMTLGSLAVKAGKFLISKYKNGKPVGEAKVVQVTKQSTREICYAIINNYAGKYVNMEQIFSELGITSESLADLDMSSCDKLADILKKYKKPESNKITKNQYSRIEKAYRNMLKHYYNIGDGIIKNFNKYTKADNEKDDNLLIASSEKLQNMWDSQKDIYDNNFPRVIVEIVGSYSAIAYNDFIVEKVIPVFKSGLAGDADYVLEAMPKKGEYFVLRQTEGQPWMQEKGEKQMGNTAIAEITGFDKESKEISFKLIARLENDGNLVVNDNGIAEINGDVNYDFYADGDGNVDEQKLAYGKWLALDPALTDWKPVGESSIIKAYITKDSNRYVVYGEKDARDKEEGYSVIYVGLFKMGMTGASSLVKIDLSSNMTKDGFETIFKHVKYEFRQVYDESFIKNGVNKFKGEPQNEEAGDAETVAEIINKFIGGDDVVNDKDAMYTLNYVTADNKKQTMTVFAKQSSDKEDSASNVFIAQNDEGSNAYNAVYNVNMDPVLLKTAFAEIFKAEDRIKNEEGVSFKFDANESNDDVKKKISETENPNEEKAANDDELVAIIARLLKGCKSHDEDEDDDKVNIYNLNYLSAENEKQNMVVFSVTADQNDSIKGVYVAQKKADDNNYSAVYKVDVDPILLKEKYASIFSTEGRIKNEQGVTFKFEQGDHNQTVIDAVTAVNNPNQEKVSDDNGIVELIARLLNGCKANEEGGDDVNPYDEILKKLDEIIKLIEEGFSKHEEMLKKLQEFKGFPGLQISIEPWNVEIGIKDAQGNDINVVIYSIYQEATKKTYYIVGFTGMKPANFAVLEQLNTEKLTEAINKLCELLKKGKRGFTMLKKLVNQNADKDETYVKFESRLNEIAPDVVNCVGFVLPQQGQQNPQQGQQNPQQGQQNPQQNGKFGIVQKGNPTVKGLSIKVEGNEQQQWLHIVDAGIYYTKSDMKWQNPTTFSIGISVENIKNAKPNSPVECELKIENNFGIKTNTNIFAAKGKNLKSEIRRLWSEYGQKVADAKILVAADFNKLSDAKKQQWSSNEGIKVSYSHKVMNEGVSTNTVITRHFKNFPKNCYVLSESYFDLGKDMSKLSNPVVAKKLKTRSQVFGYVKENLDAKIFNLTESQTYKISSYTGNRPSLMTPLYENVYVVKFNDDDIVSTMKYLGKFKIQ